MVCVNTLGARKQTQTDLSFPTTRLNEYVINSYIADRIEEVGGKNQGVNIHSNPILIVHTTVHIDHTFWYLPIVSAILRSILATNIFRNFILYSGLMLLDVS